jgi:hypothetical protein
LEEQPALVVLLHPGTREGDARGVEGRAREGIVGFVGGVEVVGGGGFAPVGDVLVSVMVELCAWIGLPDVGAGLCFNCEAIWE